MKERDVRAPRQPLSFVAQLAGVVFALTLSGCAVQTPRLLAEPPNDLPRRVELARTPFFPQQAYQCGPAALATVLSAAGLPTGPQTLVDQVFLPAREGSLQLEMLAASRRQGAVATRVPGSLAALLRETAAGNPVVVLQNLGLSWVPVWHYAVVIGYDLDEGNFVLRSGTTARLEIAFSTFEHTWDRSQRWGFVSLPPGKLPETASEDEATRALVAFERNAPPTAAARAYAAGHERWPDNPVLAIGLGNARYATGDLGGAEQAVRAAADRHASAAAFNNLARVLLELGRRDEARQAAQQAVQIGGPLRETALATLRAVEQ